MFMLDHSAGDDLRKVPVQEIVCPLCSCWSILQVMMYVQCQCRKWFALYGTRWRGETGVDVEVVALFFSTRVRSKFVMH